MVEVRYTLLNGREPDAISRSTCCCQEYGLAGLWIKQPDSTRVTIYAEDWLLLRIVPGHCSARHAMEVTLRQPVRGFIAKGT
jgi:hypothetical protein